MKNNDPYTAIMWAVATFGVIFFLSATVFLIFDTSPHIMGLGIVLGLAIGIVVKASIMESGK